MKTSSRFLTGLLSWVLLANASATILINEVHMRTPLSTDALPADSNFEFVELKSTTGGVEPCTDLWILLIDNDGGSVGGVSQAWKLVDANGGTLSTGTNGLLLLGDNYTKPKSPYENSKATATTLGDPPGMGSDNIPNKAFTIALVQGYTNPAPLGADTKPDFDKDDDGVLDWQDGTPPAVRYTVAPWTVVNFNLTSNPLGAVDSVGFNGDSSGIIKTAYCGSGGVGANLSNSTFLRGVTATAFIPHSIARGGGNNVANSRTAWYGGILPSTGNGDTEAYGASVFNLISGQTWAGFVTPGRPNLSLAPQAAIFRLNEIHANPPGNPGRSAPGSTSITPATPVASDGNFEYLEIINTVANQAGGTDFAGRLAGYALLVVDNHGSTSVGTILEAWDLSKFSTGSNGLLLLGDGYTSGYCPWIKNVASATQLGDPEAAFRSGSTTIQQYSSMSFGDIPNDGVTFMLVQNFTGNVGDDLDTDDNGTINTTVPYTLVDGVAIPEIDANHALVATRGGYSAASLSIVLANASRYDPDNLSRLKGTNTANSAAAWSYGSLGANSPYALAYENGFYSPSTGNAFRGAASPGQPNYNFASQPVTPTGSAVLLNEVHIDPPVTPDGTEYVEVISTTPHALLTNCWLMAVQAYGANSGKVLKVLDLRSQSTGSNRLALFGDGVEEDVSTLPPFCSAETLRSDPPTIFSNGSASTDSGNNFTPDSLDNAGVTVLLVTYTATATNPVPAVIGTILTGPPPGVVVLDSLSTGNGIGLPTSANPALLSQAGWIPANVSRSVGNPTPNSLGAWFGGDLTGGTAASFEYGTHFFGFKGAASPGRHNVTATVNNTAALLLNEININPPGGDNNKEFIELRTADNTVTSTIGYSVILLDNSGTDIGHVIKVYDLDSASTGTNGLLLIGSGYNPAVPSSIPWVATSPPEAATTIFPPSEMAFDDIGANTDNGALAVLLVKYFHGRVGDDLDMGTQADLRVADDGILNSPVPWDALSDSVSMKGFTTTTVGASTTYSLAGTIPRYVIGVVTFSTTDLTVNDTSINGYTPDTVARFGNKLTPNNAAAWYGANLTGTAGTSTVYSTSQYFPNTLTGGKVTPGQANILALTDLSDPDGDGVVDIMEEALGMNIFVPDTPKLPQPGYAVYGGINQPVFRVARPTGGVASITYTYEASYDLIDWTYPPVYLTPKETLADTPTVGMETKVYGFRPGAQLTEVLATGRVFFRLRVSR